MLFQLYNQKVKLWPVESISNCANDNARVIFFNCSLLQVTTIGFNFLEVVVLLPSVIIPNLVLFSTFVLFTYNQCFLCGFS